MLELKSVCENCGKPLPYNSPEAMICTFECTFCKDCVENILKNVCPNCGGGFEKRPVRPKELLHKYPASLKEYVNPLDLVKFQKIFEKYKDIKPDLR